LIDRVVTNTTCLIGLERIGRLELLPQVFPVVFAPRAVQAEIGMTVSWLQVTVVKNLAVVAALRTQMDIGEAEVLALAIELGNVVVILDDKKARRVASQVGLSVIGTVGMLLRAKRQGIIPEIKPLLQALDEANFRLADALRQNALRLAGED